MDEENNLINQPVTNTHAYDKIQNDISDSDLHSSLDQYLCENKVDNFTCIINEKNELIEELKLYIIQIKENFREKEKLKNEEVINLYIE